MSGMTDAVVACDACGERLLLTQVVVADDLLGGVEWVCERCWLDPAEYIEPLPLPDESFPDPELDMEM